MNITFRVMKFEHSFFDVTFVFFDDLFLNLHLMHKIFNIDKKIFKNFDDVNTLFVVKSDITIKIFNDVL